MKASWLLGSVSLSLRTRWTRMGLYAALGAWGVALIVALLYWTPEWREMAQARRAVAHERAQALAAMERRTLVRAYRLAQLHIPGIEKKMIAPHVQTSLVVHLGALAKRHQLQILGERYGEVRHPGRYRVLTLDMDLMGRYPALRGFLVDLNRLPTWTLVRAGRITAIPGPPGWIKAHLRLATYYRGETTHGGAGP